jgi:hypothetical protein
MMAGLMSVLLIVAAMGVDLGNAWQRKITVQKSVDVSAVSAGYLLPRTDTNTTEILIEVANYLNKASNLVAGQPGSVTADQLSDTIRSNGEVTFVDDETMKVVAPQAHVDYGLANIFGFDSVEVSAEATVQIRKPLAEVSSVLPMWVPQTCVYGPLAGDDAANPPPSASPTYTLNTPRADHTTSTISPLSTEYGTVGVAVSVTIENIASGKTGAIVRFTFGDTTIIDYRVTWTTATTGSDNSRTVTVNLDDVAASRTPAGASVVNSAGIWEIWPLIPDAAAPPALPLPTDVSGVVKYPKRQGQIKNQGHFEVTGGGEVACDEHQRGNFGQLDSPRSGVNQKQTRYGLNVALGLDHEIAVFEDPPNIVCEADGNPVGALVDDPKDPPLNGRNCIYVDSGNDPIGLTNGLLDGVSGYPGRLVASGPSACGIPTTSFSGHTINNDSLSCYLKPGYTLADIASDDSPFDALDVSIFDSPRFFWIPVVYATTRETKRFLAVMTFAPVFLTDETTTSAKTSNNGLVLNSGGKVQSVQLFGFSENALPVKPNADTTDYEEGGRKVVRMID